jgi:RAD51-like protein 2
MPGSPNLPFDYLSLVFHVKIHMLTDLMTFMHHLPSLLNSHPKVGIIPCNIYLTRCYFCQLSLLVINSISFPFQGGQNLSIPTKNYLLERLKQVLTKACAMRNLTVRDQSYFNNN